jgi:hypothetical protein
MKRSLNDFADEMGTSYASKHNAQIALTKNARSNGSYSTAIVQRTDGRFAAIVINPDQDSFHYFLHCTNIGVFGLTV